MADSISKYLDSLTPEQRDQALATANVQDRRGMPDDGVSSGIVKPWDMNNPGVPTYPSVQAARFHKDNQPGDPVAKRIYDNASMFEYIRRLLSIGGKISSR